MSLRPTPALTAPCAGARKLAPALTAELSRALSGISIARLTMGRDMVFETATPTVTLGGVKVLLPPNPFLQSTAEGEAALQRRVLDIVGKAKAVADLFSGVGTFALPLATSAKVHAVEQDAPALAALAAAARNARASSRSPPKPATCSSSRPPRPELKQFDAVVLDPPRAGAEAQVRAIAAKTALRTIAPKTIAYVSCDAASFAHDAAILAQAGWRPGPVTPIDQFLWSSHIELVGGFSRG